MALRTKAKTPDIATLRRELADLDAEVAKIDDALNAASARREALQAQRDAETDAVQRWGIDEQLDQVKTEIVTLSKAKIAPQTRASKLRVIVSPVLEREREAAKRSALIDQYEKLLEAAAMLARAGELAAEARDVSKPHSKHGGFDPSIHEVRQLCTRWETTTVPLLRRHLAEHRRFVAAVDDERDES